MPGVKTRCVIRDANLLEKDIADSSWLRTSINRMALRFLFPRADAIICLSEGLKSNLCKMTGLPGNNISVIPNPYLPSVGLALSAGQTNAGHAAKPCLIVACGRLALQKDYQTLLSAFHLVRKSTNAHLAIIGEGPLRAELGKQAEALGIAKDIDFVGHSDDPTAWIRRASAFVMTSRWEGFPNVLLEALGCGCPIVATNCSDTVPELLGGGRYGDIRAIGDAVGISESLLAILAGATKFDSASAQLLRYDLDAIAERYLAILVGGAMTADKISA
jgi:glycosyltransferase involved in cell wall biosynthesis